MDLMDAMKVNPARVWAQAKALEQAAQDCQQQASQARQLAASLPDSWKGDSAAAMQEKYIEWAAEQEKIGIRVGGIAKMIRQIVTLIQDADKSAAGGGGAVGSGGGGGFR